MAKYKIIYDREACIGALACAAVSPQFWLVAADGKVDLKDATYNEGTKKWELIIESEKDFKLNKDAEGVCPVNVIKVEKIED